MRRPNVDLRDERPMDWTPLRNLQEPGSLLAGQLSRELKPPVDSIDVALFRFAFRAVHGVDPRVTKAHRYSLQRPTLASRVQRDRH